MEKNWSVTCAGVISISVVSHVTGEAIFDLSTCASSTGLVTSCKDALDDDDDGDDDDDD